MRDKDAVNATLLICEAAAWYAKQGKTLLDAINGLYDEFGWYKNDLLSFAFEGESGMHTMQQLMKDLRSNPPMAIAGLEVEQLVDYLKNLRFTEEDIQYLHSKHIFSREFLDYLRDFQFSCDVWAIPEGTPIFPGEPIVTVRGPAIQAQFVETMVLLCVNHQSLIATKANRIVRAAQGRAVMEFGSRRAQGFDGAMYGARAAYIGGCAGTACTISDQMFGVPALGTMAHSWVQLFPSEYEAFKAYAQSYPGNCVLLVDTYNVLKSGVPNAIKVFNEVLVPQGFRPAGIRIDSGDIT